MCPPKKAGETLLVPQTIILKILGERRSSGSRRPGLCDQHFLLPGSQAGHPGQLPEAAPLCPSRVRTGGWGLPQPPAWPSAALSSFSSLTRTASPRPELPPRPFPICPRGSQGCVLEPDRGAPDAARTTSAPGLQAPRRPHGVCHPPWVPESRARLCLLCFSSDFRTHRTPS